MRHLPLLLLLSCLAAACVNPPEFPDEPVITFERINKDQVFQFLSNFPQPPVLGPLDSIEIQFSFTDGDGDLSQLDGDSLDVFLTDSRTNIEQAFNIPMIPVEGTGNGISGDVFITVVNTQNICCIFNGRVCIDDPRMPLDTFSYSIRIKDRAGNFSNRIQTTPITIVCDID